jgi:hypothetical protein
MCALFLRHSVNRNNFSSFVSFYLSRWHVPARLAEDEMYSAIIGNWTFYNIAADVNWELNVCGFVKRTDLMVSLSQKHFGQKLVVM